MPRLTLPSARAALARPAVLATSTTLALAALLGGGLIVANATDAGPMTAVEATASPEPTEAARAASGDGNGDGSTTSGGDDNVAVAANTRDGSTVYAVRLKVKILNSDPDTVDSANAAVAVASCDDCQTVAIALEGVVVTGDAETIVPVNLALAVNNECSSCQTLAYAYQNLQTVDGRARMTGDGRRRVAQLRQQLNALRRSGLEVPAVRAEVNRIAGEFAQILDTTIVPVGRAEAPASAAPSATGAASTPAASSTPSEGGSTPTAPSSEPATGAPSPQQDAAPSSEPAEPAPSTAAPQPSPTA